MDILSNRELALSFWIIISIIFVFCFPQMKKIRHSITQVLKSLFVKVIITILILMVIYIIVIVLGLYKIGLWEIHQSKNTIIWALSVGTISLLRINSKKKDPHFFKNSVLDNLKLIILIEFIIEFYAFSLIIEILLIPVFIIIGGMLGIAQSDKKYKVVEIFLNRVMVTFGIVVIFYSIYMLVTSFGEFANIQTVYDFYIPPLLTLLYLPFIFIIMVYTTYENIFVRLQFFIKNQKLIRFTKLYIIYRFHVRIKKLERWASILNSQDLSTKKNIINSVNSIFNIYKREKNPKEILLKNGWSPYEAKDYLLSEGIETSFYNPIVNNEWGAHSNYIDIDNDVFPNKISFYLDGDETTVKSLTITTTITNKKTAKLAHKKMLFAVKKLLKAALDFDITNEIEKNILKGKNQYFSIGSSKVTIEKNTWSQYYDRNYDIKFILSK